MKRAAAILVALTFAFGFSPQGGEARANSITYTITDIMTSNDPGSTFVGTGFAGMHPGQFDHFFMYETFANGSVWSRTILNVDISALAASIIHSASLDYVLREGSADVGQLTLTSFTADGTLSYHFPSPPDVIATATYMPIGLSANTLDVTALLSERVGAGASWFGLYFAMDSPGVYHWTVTGPDRDAARVRLRVDYDPIPEPASLSLLVLGVLALARRRSLRSGRR